MATFARPTATATCSSKSAGLPAVTWWSAAAMAVVIGFSRTSFGLLLPAIKRDLAGSYGVYGWVASANFAGYLAGTLATLAMLRYLRNREHATVVSLVLLAITTAAQAFCHTLVVLAMLRAINGIAQAAVLVFCVSLALEAAQPNMRARVSAIVWMGVGIGIAIVGSVTGLALKTPPALPWRELSILMGALTLVPVLGFRRPIPAASSDTGATSASSSSFAKLPYVSITIAYGLMAMEFIVFFTYFSAFARHAGISPASVGLVLSAAGIFGGMGAVVWGRVYDRIGAWAAPISLCVTAAGGLALLVPSVFVEGLGAALIASSSVGFAALVSVLIRRYTTSQSFAGAFSISTIVFAVCQFIIVPPAGALADRFGLPATMLIVVVTAAFGALISARGIVRAE